MPGRRPAPSATPWENTRRLDADRKTGRALNNRHERRTQLMLLALADFTQDADNFDDLIN